MKPPPRGGEPGPADSGLVDEAPFAELRPLAPLRRREPRAAAAVGPWPLRLYVRAWDATLGSLPVLLLAVLAGLSWWLVRSTPEPESDAPERALRHEPDYTMQHFAMSAYGADGRLQHRLAGEALRHYPDTQTLEIDAIRMVGFDTGGQLLRGRAERGWSREDGSELRLNGKVLIQRERLLSSNTPADDLVAGRLEFLGERLDVFPERKTLRSSLPVTLRDRRSEVHGGTLDYDHVQRVAVLGGGVRGRFLPPEDASRLAPLATVTPSASAASDVLP